MEISTLIKIMSENIVIFIFILTALVIGFIAGKVFQKLKDSALVKKHREDAVKRSRAVLGGLAAEQVSPFLPGFPCNPADVRFIGKPVDFIAFPGTAEGGSVEEICFIEVKSGQSRLSERERQIKAAVEQGRVRYIEYRIP